VPHPPQEAFVFCAFAGVATPLGLHFRSIRPETLLASARGRHRLWQMESWTVAEMHELARAIVAAGDSFYVRRVLQRLERGELKLCDALRALRSSRLPPSRSRVGVE
jgi:hypothetical protein